jgi:hypothetical protein
MPAPLFIRFLYLTFTAYAITCFFFFLSSWLHLLITPLTHTQSLSFSFFCFTQSNTTIMQATMASFAPEHQPYFYPPDHPRSNPSSRRASATTTTNYSSSRSSRSVRDRRRSSGAISTHSQQKPKKCIGDYVVGKTLGKGASGKITLQ